MAHLSEVKALLLKIAAFLRISEAIDPRVARLLLEESYQVLCRFMDNSQQPVEHANHDPNQIDLLTPYERLACYRCREMRVSEDKRYTWCVLSEKEFPLMCANYRGQYG